MKPTCPEPPHCLQAIGDDVTPSIIGALLGLAQAAAGLAEELQQQRQEHESAGSGQQQEDESANPLQQQREIVSAVAELRACIGRLALAGSDPASVAHQLKQLALPLASALARVLLGKHHWGSEEQKQQDSLAVARVAAARSCAFLGCANLGGEGGPMASEGVGKRCR